MAMIRYNMMFDKQELQELRKEVKEDRNFSSVSAAFRFYYYAGKKLLKEREKTKK